MTKFLTKLKKLEQEVNYPVIQAQVEEIVMIDRYVQVGKPLKQAPSRLGLLPDEFEDILAEVGPDKKKALTDLNNLLNNFRQYISLKYGIWSVANIQTAKLIKNELHVRTRLEIMAGNAYWSQALAQVGVEMHSTDSLEWAKTSTTGAKPFYPVEDLVADQAIKKYHNVDLILCSWSPNFGRSDLDTILAWQKYNPNSHLLFIGEKDGATNSPEFWHKNWFKNSTALDKVNSSFQSFDFINEQVFEIDNEF